MHKYVARQAPEGHYEVLKDGNIMLCPKLMYPMIVQGQTTMGQPVMNTQLMRLPCSTGCPFAELNKTVSQGDNVPQDTYTIECEGGKKTLKIDEISVYQAPSIIKGN